MLNRRFLFALAALAPLVYGMPAHSQEALVVGAYPSNPPWEFRNEAGEFEGFEIDVAKEVAKRLGREVEFQDLGFQALFSAVASGRIDFAVSSISITDERLQNQAFTQAYYDSEGSVLGSESSDVASVEDLEGKTLGAVAATTGEAWLKENQAQYGIASLNSYNTQQDLLLDVQNGRIDGAAGEVSGFQYAMTQMPGMKILIRIPTGEHFAMMTRKAHPDLQAVNDAVSAMKEDGTMARIHETYFGVPPQPGSATVTPAGIPQAQ